MSGRVGRTRSAPRCALLRARRFRADPLALSPLSLSAGDGLALASNCGAAPLAQRPWRARLAATPPAASRRCKGAVFVPLRGGGRLPPPFDPWVGTPRALPSRSQSRIATPVWRAARPLARARASIRLSLPLPSSPEGRPHAAGSAAYSRKEGLGKWPICFCSIALAGRNAATIICVRWRMTMVCRWRGFAGLPTGLVSARTSAR